jgi:hypothetical protein
MSCIEKMKYEILMEKKTFKESREFIEKNSDEVYYVPPGYKIFNDYYVIGIPPIALGIKGNSLIFTYTKPCYGTFVLSIDSEDSRKEIYRLREVGKKNTSTSLKNASSLENSKKPQTSFQDIWKK